MKTLPPLAAMALGLCTLSCQALETTPALKRARIELPAAMQVAPGQLTLGRVARITSNDLPLLKQLMRMSVGAAPGLGGAVTVQRTQLARVAERVRSQEGVVLEWVGAPATEISVKGQSVKASEVIQAARAALANSMQLRAVRSHAELVSAPMDTLVPAGELELRVRPVGTGAAFARRATVWTEIWCDGQFYQAVPTTFEVHADGLFAQAASGATLAAAPPVARAVESVPQDAPVVRLQPIAAPQAKLQVQRGQSALLHSSAGPISVQATVQVLQDGVTGQSVQVKSASKNEVFYARVIGPGQLEVVR